MLRPVRSVLSWPRNASNRSPITSTKPILKSPLPVHANEEALPAHPERKLIKRRLFHVEETIRKKGTKHAIAHAHEFLSEGHRVPTKIRGEFMKHCVTLFLDKGDWNAAYSIYWRMRGELLPERARALAELLQRSMKLPSKSQKLDQAIRDITNTLEMVDEAELGAILNHFIRTKTNILVTRHLVAKFGEKKGHGWTFSWKIYALLAQAESQKGYDAAAEEAFKKSRAIIGVMKKRQKLTAKQCHDYKRDLFTHLFVGYAAFNKARPLLFEELLQRMKTDAVAPSPRICSVLINLKTRKGHGKQAFAFYRAMRYQDPPIPPDSAAFRHLFLALQSRGSYYWKIKYEGRRLFQHMSQQHVNNTNSQPANRSNIVNSHVLNAALLLFMRKKDYAAATVTMRTFPVCSILPSENTRLFVIGPLMARIKKELLGNPSTGVILWSHRMLGEVVRMWQWRGDFLHEKLLRTVRHFSREIHEGIDMQMLLGLLRRAMICSADLWPGKDPVKENAAVNKAMAKANADMLPKQPIVPGWYATPNYL